MKTKKVAIIGASGYSGEELVRLLLSHPHAELAAVTSRQYAGQTLAQIFPKFASHPRSQTLRFSEPKVELLAKQAQTPSSESHSWLSLRSIQSLWIS